MLIATLIRLYQLDYPSLVQDELWTWNRAINPPSVIIHDLLEKPIFPPLYYLLIHYWTNITGYSEIALRMPSLLISILTIPLVYYFTRMLFGSRTAYIAVILMVFSPYHFYFSRFAKMYAMLWFFTVFSMILTLKIIREPKDILFPYLILTTIIINYLSYTGLIVWMTLNLIFYTLSGNKKDARWIISQIIIAITYIPWISSLSKAITSHIGIGWIPPIDNHLIFIPKIFYYQITGLPMMGPEGLIHITSCILLLSTIAYGLVRVRRSDPSQILLLILWIVIPVLLGFTVHIVSGSFLSIETLRYIGHIYIPLLIMSSLGVSKIESRIQIFVFIVILSLLFIGIIIPHLVLEVDSIYEKDRRFTDDVNEFIDDDTVALILHPGELPVFLKYYNLNGIVYRNLDFETDYDSIIIVRRIRSFTYDNKLNLTDYNKNQGRVVKEIQTSYILVKRIFNRDRFYENDYIWTAERYVKK